MGTLGAVPYSGGRAVPNDGSAKDRSGIGGAGGGTAETGALADLADKARARVLRLSVAVALPGSTESTDTKDDSST